MRKIITSDDPTGCQITDLFRSAYDKAQLTEEHSQILLTMKKEDFEREMLHLIHKYARSTYRYVDEEVESSYRYLSGYDPNREASFEEVLKDLNRQAKVIGELFKTKPDFDIEWARNAWANLPEGAEKLFLIPRWEIFADTYDEAIRDILIFIEERINGEDENIDIDEAPPICQSRKSQSFFERLTEEQPSHKILVVPAQFGIRHRGRSIRHAREVMYQNECGLGTFAIGIMLLTHRNRLRQYEDLWIDCAGDEYSQTTDDDDSPCSPCFAFDEGRIFLGGNYIGEDIQDNLGSASMYLLK